MTWVAEDRRAAEADAPVFHRTFEAKVEAIGAVRRELTGCLEGLQVPDLVAIDAALVATELCAHAAVHGGVDAVVDVWVGPDDVRVRVCDDGSWGPNGSLPAQTGVVSEHGRGLIIVAAACSELLIAHRPGATVVDGRIALG